jgi:ligand-binding SRPBCC domain-containing protein
MKIKLSTKVGQNYLKVKGGFNAELFQALNPPFPPVKLLRFDGSSPGDLVSLKLNFIIFKQVWISKITADHLDEKEYFFVDEGIKLPFFLKKWRHKHRIVAGGKNQSIIIDEINFSSSNRLLDYLIYPVLFFQFSMRKPIYRKFFSNKT